MKVQYIGLSANDLILGKLHKGLEITVPDDVGGRLIKDKTNWKEIEEKKQTKGGVKNGTGLRI